MGVEIKICGLKDEATLEAALDAGADFVGLVSFPKSPRHVGPERAAALASRVGGRAGVVLLTVDADDAHLAELIAAAVPAALQLHGRETPERVRELRRRFGRPVWKAVPVGTAEDIVAARAYRDVSDRLLFDAKPPKGAVLPGGNGAAFDWTILQNLDPGGPFVLSGGLTPENVSEALAITRAAAVDVSSGVESAPGVKDPERIRSFVRAVRSGG